MSEQNQLLSTRQAATLLGVSVRTIQLWVEQGLLSAWKTPGGHRRIVQESLLSLLHKRQKMQPLTSVLCVNLDADFFKLLQVLCQQWHFPVELQQARNAVDALLMMGEQKPELVLMTFEQQGIDMPLFQQELTQHQVKLALLSAEDPQPALRMEMIWLRQPFEPLQFKTELQKLVFARLQQAG
ncbi:MAG: helix-turn-helix domain-containing protein [Gammaproteobacteria bacterium]|nr:helix-turn-helix domain-containing protein [Gammaproteobacteria bacterium]MBU2059861.1 helix-turn-helix domain-containing protein [Gammaproteobacteria bacterium]MBU2175358.1 helix-turn-helix domain-containing protein [Gammaproteobacteria bacterium]MBU2245734.1 helix-turn-helix domain-containing protein [Gammaproteobacteria bacterium]MBU2345138.1 helix-turn-helix domain-containing protein [Gammaproteobacteria bacterium]